LQHTKSLKGAVVTRRKMLGEKIPKGSKDEQLSEDDLKMIDELSSSKNTTEYMNILRHYYSARVVIYINKINNISAIFVTVFLSLLGSGKS
jgi:hypothetical protein